MTSHIRTALAAKHAFGKDEVGRRYPHAFPIRTLCESCTAMIGVLVSQRLGVLSLAQLVNPMNVARPFKWTRIRLSSWPPGAHVACQSRRNLKIWMRLAYRFLFECSASKAAACTG
jgi:hypothetical protein